MNIEQFEGIVPDVTLFVDRRCFPDWEIIKQKIDFHDLTFIIGGQANYYMNGIQYTAGAGDIIYIPEGSIREAHTFKNNPMHSFAFNFTLHPDNTVRLPFDTVTKNYITSETLSYIREFTQVWMSKQPGYRMHARGLFHLIIHRLLTISYHQTTFKHTDARINKIREFIIDHYSEDLDLVTVAKIVCLHPVYFSKLFKTNTGFTFKEFLNHIRVNNAEMLLSTGGFSVSEVAESCGYKDISYFSNVFKSVKGYSPSMVSK